MTAEEKSLGTLLLRGLRLRCPRCGQGKLFRGWFSMHERCPQCRLKYERAPGYFLGSAYINYGITAFVLTVGYVGLHFGAGVQNEYVVPPLAAFCLLFPLFFFRYARALWLSMDFSFDTTGFEEEQ